MVFYLTMIDTIDMIDIERMPFIHRVYHEL